ncbi:MAG: hypothetical protein MRK02_16245 [Candidatus Scalindua sp.]|nr:hypothetical protein [Candidatus Scalindua sp.]
MTISPNNRINLDWQIRCVPLPAGYPPRVCRACYDAWEWKSPVQADEAEGQAKPQGYQKELVADWELASKGELPFPIEPLK